MQITAELVKRLREKTGVGMMECKSALVESGGDLAEAEKILRKRGLAAAASRAGRATGEGVIACRLDPASRWGLLVELNCETDFAARSEEFQKLVLEVLDELERSAPASEGSAARPGADLMDLPLRSDPGRTLGQRISETIVRIGENVQLRRYAKMVAGESDGAGVVGSYVHMGSKIGVLVELALASRQGAGDPAARSLARDIAMHVAAAAPRFLHRNEVRPEVLAEEREIAREQALKSGKPPAVVDRIVQGRMEKFFEEACLEQQPFVRQPDKTVGAILEEAAASLGGEVRVRRFVRFVLGQED
jgi:elongation factor Ts